MRTQRAKDAPFQIRFTMPGLPKWGIEGYTERVEAERRIAALLADDEDGLPWTVESRGLRSEPARWEREEAATGEQKATTDRAAAIEAMRGRVITGTSRRTALITLAISEKRHSTLYLSREDDAPVIRIRSHSLPPAQAREFALALEVLAEIAEQWEAKAGEAATK